MTDFPPAHRSDTSSAAGPPARPPAGQPDLVGVALGSIASGALTGAAAVALGLALLRDRLDAVLAFMPFAGMMIGATCAWVLATPITDTWRRGVTAALGVFGALMLTALTAPVDMLGGRAGLVVFALALAVGAALAMGYTRRRGLHGG